MAGRCISATMKRAMFDASDAYLLRLWGEAAGAAAARSARSGRPVESRVPREPVLRWRFVWWRNAQRGDPAQR